MELEVAFAPELPANSVTGAGNVMDRLRCYLERERGAERPPSPVSPS
jgi:hypothetical protein